jgi:rare lipoprotein A
LQKTVIALGATALALFSALPAGATSSGCTAASYYGHGDGFHGRRTANGERFDGYGTTTAHRTLPFGTRLRVTNQSNGRSVIVRVTDRGPFIAGRGLDLSYGAFSNIAHPGQGVAKVCYSKIA